MEFGFLQLWQDGWVGAIAHGAALTVAVGLLSMIGGLIIGTICGILKWRRVFPLWVLVDVYTSLVRGVPELLIIYLLFFSSVEFVTEVARGFGFTSLDSSGFAFIVAVVSIGTISGAYSTEVVRGALASIPNGHIDAAQAVGLSRGRTFRRIVLPQMLRIAVPGINNIWQTTIKDTALVSVTGLAELMRISYVGAGSTRHPFMFYIIAAFVYLMITLVSQTGFDVAERRFNFGKRG